MLRRISTLFILLVLSSSFCCAYDVVFLTDKINKTECLNTIQSIPEEYYYAVTRIVIYDKINYFAAGLYLFPSMNIALDNDWCDREVIKHELAHSYQWANYGWIESYCLVNHCGHWQDEWDYASKI